jgi:simple sugar transport system permease protein
MSDFGRVREKGLLKWIHELMPWILGIVFSVLLILCTHESVLHVLKVIFGTSFSSANHFGWTLFYWGMLVACGLAVAIPFRAGLFNIGAEGQMRIGALAATAAALALPGMGFFGSVLAALAGVLAAGVWGGLIGYWKWKRGAHEVIASIMMNFIAYSLLSYFVMGPLRAPQTQSPESAWIPAGMKWEGFSFLDGSPAGLFQVLIVAVAVAIYFLFQKTRVGFEIKMSGLNEKAAFYSGISIGKNQVLGFFLAGACAGLAGVQEIFLNSGRLRLDFSPGFGFMGIAVALVAGGSPLKLIISAFIFAVIQRGASELDLETSSLTKDFAVLLQALVMLGASMGPGIENFLKKKAHLGGAKS